jgi:hypothetical protein
MDALRRSHFLHDITGKVYMSQHQAVTDILLAE